MRLHLILPFIGFLLKKAFSGVFKMNKKYRREMEQNPALMLFIGVVLGTLTVMVLTIITALFLSDHIEVRYMLFTYIGIAVSYILYTFFSIQFNDFLAERQELFDIIKK